MIYFSGQEKFHSLTNGELTLQEVVKKLEEYIGASPKDRYSIIVGSDAR